MATKHYKASKPNRIDPTRTVMVRKRFVMELRRRFARLRGEIVQLLLDDVFGIRRRMIKDVTVRNIFCPTGAGGGIDPSCSKDGGGSSSIGSGKDSAKLALAKLEETTVPAKNKGAKGPFVKVPMKVESSEALDKQLRKIMDDSEPIQRQVSVDSLIATQSSVRKASVQAMIDEADKPENDYMREPITVVRVGRKSYLFDGTHRTVSAKLQGKAKILAKVYSDKPVTNAWLGLDYSRPARVLNVFCPTGPGGGVDPSCSAIAATVASKEQWQAARDDVLTRLGDLEDANKDDTKEYKALSVMYQAIGNDKGPAPTLVYDGTKLIAAGVISFDVNKTSAHIGYIGSTQKGGGSAVMKQLLEQAKTAGVKEVNADASPDAIPLNRKFGFEVVGKLTPNGLPMRLVLNSEITNTTNDWQFKTNSDQVKAFQQWLRERFGYHLSIKQLMKKFAEEGYKRGIGRAFDDVEKPYAQGYALDESTGDFYKPSKMQFLKSAFASPVGKERVEQLASRSFDDLKNVTGDMATRMSRTLLEGLVDGSHPNKIAKSLSKDLDISLSRAETIARTEIIRAHAEGQLDAMQAMGVAEVGVQVEWITAQDDAVCPRCEAMEGIILEIEKAHNMIPMHPNCRCAFMPAGDVLQPRSVEDAAEAGRESVDNLTAASSAVYVADLTNEDDTAPPPSKTEEIGDIEAETDTIEQLINVFCPTGPGGGIDPTCSPGGSGGIAQAPKADPANQAAASALIEKLQGYKTKTSPARVKQLVDALKKLTVAQLKEIKQKYEVDAKGDKKAELVDRLTARLKEKIDSTIKTNRLVAPPKPSAPPAVAQKKDYIAELPKDATTDQRLDAVEKYVAENHPTDLTPLEQTRLDEIKELLSKQGRSQAAKYTKLRTEFNQLLSARYERQMKEAQHKTGARQSLLRALQVDYPADIRIDAGVPYSQSKQADVPGMPYNPTTEAEKLAMDRATQFVSALTAQSIEDDPLRFTFYKHATDGRAHQRNQKFINVGTSATNAGVLVHEMGHAIENQKPGALETCREFLLSRAADEKPQPIWGTSKEYGVEDDFKKAFGHSARYVGKTYPNGSNMSIKGATDTEVLSMGIQKLYDDPVGFIKNDRQYARLIIDILRDRTPRGFAMPIVPEPL